MTKVRMTTMTAVKALTIIVIATRPSQRVLIELLHLTGHVDIGAILQ